MNNIIAPPAATLPPTQDQLDELDTLAYTGPRPHSANEAAALLRHLIDRITPPTGLAPLAGGYKEALYLVNY